MSCDPVRAASNMKKLLGHKHAQLLSTEAVRSEDGIGLKHALWMLNAVYMGSVKGEKAHRWLGDAAGMLRSMEYLTLEDCRNCNFFT